MALHFLAESAFDDLLAAWRYYQTVKCSDRATVPEVGHARSQLDNARTRMGRVRAAMYPTEEERAVALVGVLCPVLDEFVHLAWTHQFGSGSRQLECACGELVPVPRSETPDS